MVESNIRPWVAAVRIVGGGEPEIAVELFRDRLAALGLTPDAVFQRIRGEHLDMLAPPHVDALAVVLRAKI